MNLLCVQPLHSVLSWVEECVKNSEGRWSTLRLGHLGPHGGEWSSCEDLGGGFNLKGDWESPFPFDVGGACEKERVCRSRYWVMALLGSLKTFLGSLSQDSGRGRGALSGLNSHGSPGFLFRVLGLGLHIWFFIARCY